MKKLVAFDMDGVLVDGRATLFLAERFGIRAQVEAELDRGEAEARAQRIFALFRGRPVEEFRKAAMELPLMPHAEEVFAELRKRGIATAIISDSYGGIVEHVAERLGGANAYRALRIISVDGMAQEMELPKFTGKYEEWKGQALEQVAEALQVPLADAIAVGDNVMDIPMLRRAGIALAFNPKRPEVANAARKTISSLLEVLDYS